MKTHLNRRAPSADIILLLEGTFPYVPGGVSSWVDKMIRAFPQYAFALVFMGGRRQDYGDPSYALPDNVVHFEEHFIHETPAPPPMRASMGKREAFASVSHMHDALREPEMRGAIAGLMRELMPMLAPNGGLGEQEFLHSEYSWEMISERYEAYCTDPSFTDYFWTIRIMHKPIWQLVRISEQLPSARIYHTVSTGYAGFLGALLSFRGQGRLLVSEHGIYTKERKIDLLQSQWIRDNRGVFERDTSRVGYLQDLWVRFFEALGRICYEAADDVVSLYEGNRMRQIHDGASREKTRVIPNGIAVSRFAPLRGQREAGIPKVVAFIGRVVPIKDVKTFIRAIFVASRSMPELEGWIIGPDGEDPQYAQECRDLAASLGIQDRLRFMGMQRVDSFLPQAGLVALSSISEGLPLVILEAFAAGVPVVTTEVGCCRSLIEGRDEADRALGRAGELVPIANPDLFAQAILGLLEQPEVWQAAQAAGVARVERYYTDTLMQDSYRELYLKLMHKSAASVEES